jgi:hypothetical protein
MCDLFRARRTLEAGRKIVAHAQPLTATEIGLEAAGQLLLPARRERRIPVSRFRELELDQPIEDRPAVPGGRQVPLAAGHPERAGDDGRDRGERETTTWLRWLHRKK